VRVVLKGIHRVKARLATGEIKTYCYAWRGGPQIKAKLGTPEFVRKYHDAHASLRQPRAGRFMTIVAQCKAAPEFTGLAASTRRAYLAYIKLIEEAFGDCRWRRWQIAEFGRIQDLARHVCRDTTRGGLRLDDAGADHVVRQGPRHHRHQSL
jgi:hypothetical protein